MVVADTKSGTRLGSTVVTAERIERTICSVESGCGIGKKYER